jgi:oligopeptide transport system substrate-binding protein
MNRYLKYTISLILLAVGFGCQSPSQKNNTDHFSQRLRINIQDEPQTLDPRKARSLSGQTLVRMLFEGLTRVNKEEQAELALASSVTISSDLKTYTFRLKDSIWSNGDPVVASDFAYAWRKMLSPDFPSDTSFHLYVIKNAKAAKEGKVILDAIGVKVLDEKTLEVELENSTPYFLDLLSFPAFFPIHQKMDEKDPTWSQNAATYVGNGPFQLKEWKHQDHLTVVKNEKYWDAATVKITSLELQMLQEETELKCFEKNQLDWAGSPLSTLPVDALKSLRKESKLHTKELLGTYFIRVNTELPPFNHPSMRKAFALAINRQAIVDHVTQGNQIPATGLVPISLKLQKAPYFQDGSVAESQRLFEEALTAQKLTRENFPEISLTYRTAERNHLIAQAIQQQWFKTFGIRIKLESVEGKVYFDRISKQDYQLSSGSWIADFADPINFLEVFKYKKGGSNNTLWENLRYTELLDQSAQVADPQRRIELLAQSEQILVEEMPMIPIFYYTMLYVNQPDLKDVVLSSMGQIDFKWAFIENHGKMVEEKK